jgi:hypothetical protein
MEYQNWSVVCPATTGKVFEILSPPYFLQRFPRRSEAGLETGVGATVISCPGNSGSGPLGTIEW